jgi:hypothetical protein
MGTNDRTDHRTFASGNLKGVIILENGYNENEEQSWVVVGFSENTIKAAKGIQDMNSKKTNAASSNDTEAGQQRRQSTNSAKRDTPE